MSKTKNGEGHSLFYRFIYFTIQVTLVLLIIAFIPGLPPDVEFKPYTLTTKPIEIFTGRLINYEKLFSSQVIGPEDLAVYKNELYTTTHGGWVQKIVNGKLSPVVKFGKNCKGLVEEHLCGRPLGLHFDSKGSLYVTDAYYGVFKVNVTSGEFTTLVSSEEPIEGIRPTLPNSVVSSEKTGDVYWTDSSTTHKLHDTAFSIVHNGNGRVIKYSAATKKNEVLLRNLHFPNGIALEPKEDYLIIAETFKAKLLKHYINGPKKGQTEVFADLPGFADNIRYMDGRLGVSIITVPSPLLLSLPEMPIVRKLISRIFTLIELVVNEIESVFPNEFLRKISHSIGTVESIHGVTELSDSLFVFYNNEGKVTDAYKAANGIQISDISSFAFHQGYVYLGSPYNIFVGRAKFQKIKP